MPFKRQSSALHLTPGQATYVLQRLVSDRRISQGELNRYMSEMHREIADLEQRLQSLRDAASGGPRRPGRPPRAAAESAAAAVAAPVRRRRKSKLTPEQAASRKLQGRYLGLIRQIAASKRGQYQKIAKERGREVAIKEMAAALGK